MITQKKWITHVIIAAVFLILLDLITTYFFTPDLRYEANIVFSTFNKYGKLNGYKGWIFITSVSIFFLILFILKFIFFQKFYKSVLAQKENILSLHYATPFLKDMFHLQFKSSLITGKPLLITFICFCLFFLIFADIYYKIVAIVSNTIVIVMYDVSKLEEYKDVFVLYPYSESRSGFIIFYIVFFIVFSFFYYKDKKNLETQNSLDTYKVSKSDIIYASILLIFSWNIIPLLVMLGDYFNH